MKNHKTMSSSSNDTKCNSQNIEDLFSRFAAFYGHLWRSQFKSEGFLEFAKHEWQEGLRHFSEHVITQATKTCRMSYEMPPTLPQMIRACRDVRNRHNFYVIEATPVAAKGIALFHLGLCKKLVTPQLHFN
jgi:hypothetical protein